MRAKFSIKRLAIVVVSVVSIILTFTFPTPSYAYLEGQGGAHTWLARKSIDYLKKLRPDLAELYPLDSYLPYIDQGIWYADNTKEVMCTWYYPGGEETFACDALHHYGKIEGIEAPYSTLIGYPGDFAGSQYVQALFDTAIRFWPGGTKPDLSQLPKMKAGFIRNAWEIDYKVFSTPKNKVVIDDEGTDAYSLGYTYLGGVPYCDLAYSSIIRSDRVSYSMPGVNGYWHVPVFDSSGNCPRWPEWASSDGSNKVAIESYVNSLKYLGWTLHVLEDLTMPYHAWNRANEDHRNYERISNERTSTNYYDHLPLSYGSYYKYEGQSKVDVGNTMKFCNLYLENSCSEVGYFSPKNLADQAFKYGNQNTSMERRFDAAIKLGAALLENFYDHLPQTARPGTFSLIHKNSGVYVGSSGSAAGDVINLGKPISTTDHAKFTFALLPTLDGDGGTYYIFHMFSGKYLVPGIEVDPYNLYGIGVSLYPDKMRNGDKIFLSNRAPSGYEARFKYELITVGEGYYYIRHLYSGKYVCSGSTSIGGYLHLWGPIPEGHEDRYKFKIVSATQ